MQDQSAQEREVRLKTMLVMTGMDHLLELMDEQKLNAHYNDASTSDTSASQTSASNTSSVSADFIGLFQNLLSKFDAIEEKLSSIQTAHFALQHSCSSANEVAQDALSSVQRGNPYLSKIDTILSYQTDHDVTENIICAASEMISVARRDTEAFIEALRSSTENEDSLYDPASARPVDVGSTGSILQSFMQHLRSTPQVRIA